MTKGHVFIATSLDGFIAREDGSIDWLERPGLEQEDHGYDGFIAQMDGLVMGRGCYEMVRSFAHWPYDKPVIVLSTQLAGTEPPDELRDRVWFTDISPTDLMDALDSEGWNNVYVDGGKVVQSFLRDGLIDEMVVTRLPVLIGAGRPLFGALPDDQEIVHVDTKIYPSGLTQSHYRVPRAGTA